ncbi:MAG: response regulator [bacterium]|nr:response regulator [bacterium]
MNQSKKILVVDDDQALLAVMGIWFTSEGYYVKLAESAEDALRLIEEEKIDLMISDINMPGISGLELADIVSKDYPEIKIILMSGYSKLLETNKNTYDRLSKPFKINEVIEIIKKKLSENNHNVH